MTTPQLNYIIVDVSPYKSLTKKILAADDGDALRQARDYVETDSLSDAVTVFRCLESAEVKSIGEVRRGRG